MADELRVGYGVPAGRLRVIHNPVEIGDLQASGAETPAIALPDRFFVSVGRLVKNKGGDVLMRAFAAHAEPRRHLVMLGEGSERGRLTALAEEIGIGDRVHLPGHLENPHAVVARADGYISASRSEGFPNAMIEAMALGRPVIATDCRSGPREILAPQDGKPEAGLLVPVNDIAALTAAMDLFDDEGSRADLSRRAARRVEVFRSACVVADYAEILGCGSSRAARMSAKWSVSSAGGPDAG
ncbi:MAG: glycosyltransferase [Loktanella sp.]|nr:glycosyltransferase [Loktanella sp.]